MTADLTADVAIIGAGLIGACCAYRLVRAGYGVAVVDNGAQVGGQATAAATGLMPVPHGATSPLGLLSTASWHQWPDLANELSAYTEGPLLYQPGSLAVAATPQELTNLRGRWVAESARGIASDWWTPQDIARREPAVAASICLGGLYHPQTRWVPPMRVCQALWAAAQTGPGRVDSLWGHRVTDLTATARGVRLDTDRGGVVQANWAVLCTGAWAGLGLGLCPPLAVATVWGQAASFDARSPPRLGVILQTATGAGHIVPDPAGELIVGATSEPASGPLGPPAVTAKALEGLLATVTGLVPALAGIAPRRTWSGPRPQSRQRWPLIGPLTGYPRLLAAVGHYKSGVLLAPVTAAIIADIIAGRPVTVVELDRLTPTQGQTSK